MSWHCRHHSHFWCWLKNNRWQQLMAAIGTFDSVGTAASTFAAYAVKPSF
jgi:hypothetical protein